MFNKRSCCCCSDVGNGWWLDRPEVIPTLTRERSSYLPTGRATDAMSN